MSELFNSDNEQAYVILGKRLKPFWIGKLVNPTEGIPTFVNINWEYVLEQEEKYGSVIGFIHSHPNMSNRPSLQDIGTMDAWASCFGKPLLCAIMGKNGLGCHAFRPNRKAVRVYGKLFGNYFVGIDRSFIRRKQHEQYA